MIIVHGTWSITERLLSQCQTHMVCDLPARCPLAMTLSQASAETAYLVPSMLVVPMFRSGDPLPRNCGNCDEDGRGFLMGYRGDTRLLLRISADRADQGNIVPHPFLASSPCIL